jgi:hypothetical protein
MKYREIMKMKAAANRRNIGHHRRKMKISSNNVKALSVISENMAASAYGLKAVYGET